MLLAIILTIIFTVSFRFCLNETEISDRIVVFSFSYFVLFIIGISIFMIIGNSVFSGTANQEMITKEESIVSFIDNKDNPVYVKGMVEVHIDM